MSKLLSLLEQNLTETKQDVENVQSQKAEQQKLERLKRVQEQHEQFIQKMRDQYEKVKEKCNEVSKSLDLLRVKLEASTKNTEMASKTEKYIESLKILKNSAGWTEVDPLRPYEGKRKSMRERRASNRFDAHRIGLVDE